MAVKKNMSTKRFGPRYGRNVKTKFNAIETLQKKAYPCPYCHAETAKRICTGIWKCRKCTAKFTGKAYTLPKKKAHTEILMQKSTPIVEVMKEEMILTTGEEEKVEITRQPESSRKKEKPQDAITLAMEAALKEE